MNHQSLTEEQFLFLEQINEEYRKGFLALNSLNHDSVTFYGGARIPENTLLYKEIVQIAKYFGKNNWAVISGGGPGAMKASLLGGEKVNSQTLALNINIKHEETKSIADTSLLFNNFSVRKYMLRQSDILIFVPGGIGTLDELVENLTLVSTHKITPKIIILFKISFWQKFIDYINDLITQKLIDPNILNYVKMADTLGEIHEICRLKQDE